MVEGKSLLLKVVSDLYYKCIMVRTHTYTDIYTCSARTHTTYTPHICTHAVHTPHTYTCTPPHVHIHTYCNNNNNKVQEMHSRPTPKAQ